MPLNLIHDKACISLTIVFIIYPGAVVGLKNWLRISFAIDIEALRDGLRRLKVFCQRHIKGSQASFILIQSKDGIDLKL